MSQRNSRQTKKLRRSLREIRKMTSAKAMPFGGVLVRATDVRRHRYLRDHKLPHSKSLANVLLPADATIAA